jgi:hypothetical protein
MRDRPWQTNVIRSVNEKPPAIHAPNNQKRQGFLRENQAWLLWNRKTYEADVVETTRIDMAFSKVAGSGGS